MLHALKYSLLTFFLFLGLQVSYCQDNISEEDKKAIEILKNSASFKAWKAKNKLSDNNIIYSNIHQSIINVQTKSNPNIIIEFIFDNSSKEFKAGSIEDLR